ncbi:MAG: bifunctional UDP-N-acetylglucosamine diphosphorylase/glucosamine-1-phosphate N-acetyltransferase GlmU [Myxococcota bacterium]
MAGLGPQQSGERNERSFELSDTAVIILAAGQGARMKSRRAKVLHEICGVPMLGHVLRNARALSPSRLLVVIGRDADQVRESFVDQAEFVLQEEQLGTGHAVLVAEPVLGPVTGDVLVLYADVPLLRAETIERMSAVKRERAADLVMLTARAENIPGRVVRGPDGRIARIIEAQDATPEELAIEERNPGVYLFDAALLREGLARLEPDNEQGELYLTDIVCDAVEKGRRVEALEVEEADECLGINTRRELADAARVMRRRIVEGHMDEGVSFTDPDSVYLDSDVRIGRDSIIEPGVVITGESTLGEGVHVKTGCMIESSRLDDQVEIGPSAHLRPGSHLGRGVKIGNYVEIKNSTLGPGTKAAHLGYIGDADVGEGVNFSCGAIVVNYDGVRKTRTEIGDGAFIGCNVNLVSPVRFESKAFVAAGSTITKDVPEDALAVARERQRNIEGWVARREGRSPPKSPSRVSDRKTASSKGASSGIKVRKKSSVKKNPAAKAKQSVKKKQNAKKKALKRKPASKASKRARR